MHPNQCFHCTINAYAPDIWMASQAISSLPLQPCHAFTRLTTWLVLGYLVGVAGPLALFVTGQSRGLLVCLCLWVRRASCGRSCVQTGPRSKRNGINTRAGCCIRCTLLLTYRVVYCNNLSVYYSKEDAKKLVIDSATQAVVSSQSQVHDNRSRSEVGGPFLSVASFVKQAYSTDSRCLSPVRYIHS